MKISLANLLLVTGLIAVCVGWWADRSHWTEKLSELSADRTRRDQQIYRGGQIQGGVSRLVRIADDVPLANEDWYFEWMAVQDFLHLHSYAEYFTLDEELHFSGKDALRTGKQLIDRLGCETVEEFFELSAANVKFVGAKRYPQVCKPESKECKSLEKFVDRCLRFSSDL